MGDDKSIQSDLTCYHTKHGDEKIEEIMKGAGLPVTPGAVVNLIHNPLLKEAREHIVMKLGLGQGDAPAAEDQTFRMEFPSENKAVKAETAFTAAGCNVVRQAWGPQVWVIVATCPPRKKRKKP